MKKWNIKFEANLDLEQEEKFSKFLVWLKKDVLKKNKSKLIKELK